MPSSLHEDDGSTKDRGPRFKEMPGTSFEDLFQDKIVYKWKKEKDRYMMWIRTRSVFWPFCGLWDWGRRSEAKMAGLVRGIIFTDGLSVDDL